MADVSDDAEFWLPSEFLPEEDLFMEKESLKNPALRPVILKFPNEFDSFGSSSLISSPVESTASSSETESSDEEFLAALTRRLAQSSLYETKKLSTPYVNHNENKQKNLYVSGSPQSTLTGVGRVSYPSTVSGNGSPNGPLQFPSPPETPFGGEKETWDLIYAAAGQVARLKTDFDAYKQPASTVSQRSTHLSSRCPRHLPCLRNPSSVSYSNNRLYQAFPQSAQFQGRRYDRVLKEDFSLDCRKMETGSFLQHERPQFLASGRYDCLQTSVHRQWPQSQSQNQQPQINITALKASINGGSGSKRESVGTGVFLPRRYANPPEPQKQTGFPTVRAVRGSAFGLSYKDMNENRRGHFNGGLVPNYDEIEASKYELSAHQRQGYRQDAAQKQHHDLLLPLEWTY